MEGLAWKTSVCGLRFPIVTSLAHGHERSAVGLRYQQFYIIVFFLMSLLNCNSGEQGYSLKRLLNIEKGLASTIFHINLYKLILEVNLIIRNNIVCPLCVIDNCLFAKFR